MSKIFIQKFKKSREYIVPPYSVWKYISFVLQGHSCPENMDLAKLFPKYAILGIATQILVTQNISSGLQTLHCKQKNMLIPAQICENMRKYAKKCAKKIQHIFLSLRMSQHILACFQHVFSMSLACSQHISSGANTC